MPDLGNLRVAVSVDTKGLSAGLAAASGAMRSAQASMSSAGGAAASSVEASTARISSSMGGVTGSVGRAASGVGAAVGRMGSAVGSAASGAAGAIGTMGGRIAGAMGSIGGAIASAGKRVGSGIGTFVGHVNTLEQKTSTVQRALQPVSFGMLGVAAAAGFVGVKAVQLAGNLEQARVAFTTMLGSGQAADAFLSKLQAFAASTPFEFPDLVRASQRLLAMGISADRVIPTMTGIGDAVAAIGGGKEQIDQVTTAIGQMSAKGKVQGDELLQLTEAGIPALQILADQYGVTTGQMQQWVTAGKVASADAIPKLIAGIENGTAHTQKMGGMMQAQSKTMAGIWSNLSDNITQTLTAIGESITRNLNLKGVLDNLTHAFGVIRQFAQGKISFGDMFSQLSNGAISAKGVNDAMVRLQTAVQTVERVLTNLGKSPGWQAIQSFGTWLLSNHIDAVIIAIAAAMGALAIAIGVVTIVAAPWLLIIAGVVAAVALLAFGAVLLVQNWGSVVGFFAGVWSAITGFFSAAWSAIWGTITGVVGAILSWLGANWPYLLVIILGPLGLLVGFVITHWQAIWGAISSALSAIWGGITSVFGAIFGFIAGVLGAIWSFISTWGLTILAIIMMPFLLAFIAIIGILSAVWNFVSGVFAAIASTIWGWLTVAYNFVVSILTAVWSFYVSIFTVIWNFVAGIFAAIFGTIWTWLSAVYYSAILPILTAVWSFFVSIWTTVWNFVSAIWNAIWSTISYWATTIYNMIAAWLTQNWSTINYWLTFIWTTAGNIWQGIWGTISYWAGQVRDTVGSIFNSLGTIVHGALSALSTTVGNDVNWIIHRVNDFLDKVWATFHGFGIDLPLHDIPHLEGYAYAKGGVVDKPGFFAGEEGIPETIIPWNPAYRNRARDLWQMTGAKLGFFPLQGTSMGKGAGPDLSNIPTSGFGGECLAFLSQFFSQLRGIPAAKDAASLINSNTAKPGEVAINTSFQPYGHAGLVISPPNMVLDSNFGLDHMIRIHPLADMKPAGFIDFGAKLGTLAGGAASGLLDIGSLIGGLIDQVIGAAGAGPKWLTGTLPGLLKSMIGPRIIDWVTKNFGAQIAKLTSSVSGVFSAIKGAFQGNVDDWIRQGEALAGVGDDWHAALKARIGVESGGDPNIDQHGLTGYAQAHGIMQMINSTFAAYALPGHTNIYNPVDNIAAAIRYIEKRYGGYGGMPPLSQGYAMGGIFQGIGSIPALLADDGAMIPPRSITAIQNKRSDSEYVLTEEQMRRAGLTVNVTVNGTDLHPNDVARAIVQAIDAA